MVYRLFLAILLIVNIGVSQKKSPQSKVDFSGSWVVDKGQSKLPDWTASAKEIVLKIKQEGRKMEMQIFLDGQAGNLFIDAGDSSVQALPSEDLIMKVASHWSADGKKFITVTEAFDPIGKSLGTQTSNLRFDPSGKRLINTKEEFYPEGRSEEKLVFRRK